MMSMIRSIEQAKMHFLRNLGDLTVSVKKEGFSIFIETFEGKKYCLCFKKEYYKNFQYHFPSLGKVGWGQIANKELLERCKKENYIYIAVMPDGKIYEIKPSLWLEYYRRFQTEIPHIKGEIAIPLKLFRRFDEKK